MRLFMNNMHNTDKQVRESIESLRVCYLLESFYPVIGGGETAGRLTTEGFVNQSVDLTVVTRHTLLESKQQETLFGANVQRIGPRGGIGTRRWSMAVHSFFWLIKNRKNWDIIFVDGFRALGVPAVIVGKLIGKKVVFKPQNVGEMSGEFFDGKLQGIGLSHTHWLVHPFIVARNTVLKRADAFCPHSTDMKKELLEAGVSSDKIHFIPNPYDPNKFRPATLDEKVELRRKLSIEEGKLVVIFTGRLVTWKGPQLLVRMWCESVGQDDNTLLLVVGPGGTEAANCADEIRDYIRQNRCENSIRLTGGVRNVDEYLRAADLYAYPSQGGEGSPISMTEAMACGLPVVTTRATGIVDLVTENTALVVEPQDFDGFKSNMKKMLAEPRLRQDFGLAGAERTKQLYSAEIVNYQYVNLFHSLLHD